MEGKRAAVSYWAAGWVGRACGRWAERGGGPAGKGKIKEREEGWLGWIEKEGERFGGLGLLFFKLLNLNSFQNLNTSSLFKIFKTF
jgi:hypothetical protein